MILIANASVDIIPNKSRTGDGGVSGTGNVGGWVGSEGAIKAYKAVW